MSIQNPTTNNKLVNQVFTSRPLRKFLVTESHYWFFHYYFYHYVKFTTAQFQKEMFMITEDEGNKLSIIVAFRGSAKSTIMSLSYPLWAILGRQQKKFVLILSQTQQQAKMHLYNLRKELESNELLRQDLGPFTTHEDEWGSTNIVLSKYDARITIASSEQSIRGARHGAFRPDLIICDDVEDIQSVKTKEGRDKTYFWLTGEIIPAGDQNTRIIIVGNLLHEDSLLMRLKEDITEGRRTGIFKEYPILNESGISFWPGKFPDQKSIEELKQRVGDEASWSREYLLHIISDAERVVHPEWLHFYDHLPCEDDIRFIAMGVDLAISQRDTADHTAIVSAMVCGYDDQLKIYILPNPVNEHLNFPQTHERIKATADALGSGNSTYIYVEDVGYQAAVIQQLQEDNYFAEGFKTKGADKRSRLVLTTQLIQRGIVVFPRKGAKQLTDNLIGFGKEKHDDLADAFAILINSIMQQKHGGPVITVIDTYDEDEESFLG